MFWRRLFFKPSPRLNRSEVASPASHTPDVILTLTAKSPAPLRQQECGRVCLQRYKDESEDELRGWSPPLCVTAWSYLTEQFEHKQQLQRASEAKQT